MSLPPGFLDELRTRTSLSQVVGRKVTWDMRKSNQGKGDMWAPCPFHEEKTASFHVDERKGFYYCFGCHAKGDAISFVKESENVGFMEAVEILAREAGMAMPARDPKAAEKAEKRAGISGVMESAVQFYRLQLATRAGERARDYLAGRALGEEAQARWELGYAPDSRRVLTEHLLSKGIPEAQIVEAGLAIRPDDGSACFDRFRGRVIFPIRDARGRAISLGGRALDAHARAKYLNGPETPLFDKGRSLFNLARAREAAGKGQTLIVAEGYMDVIALSEAGFHAAVAPLGTAVTEDQLRLIWRISPEPVMALDGDKAGLRAAMRVIDLALPVLEAGQALRFVLLPEGLDPDDLIRAQGPGAMQKLIDTAMPMVRLLWQRETEGRVFDSPERKAALDRDLRALIAKIADPGLRRHYGHEINNLRRELFTGNRPAFKPGRRSPPARALSETRASLLATGGGAVEVAMREAVILATLITHPELVEEELGALERIEMTGPDHAGMLAAILRAPDADLRAHLAATCGEAVLNRLFALRHVQIAPALRHPEDHALAAQSLAQEVHKLQVARGVQGDVEEAVADLMEGEDERVDFRLKQAAQALNEAGRGHEEEENEFEQADSGALMDKRERAAFDALLEGIDFSKGRKA